jgi:signal transduction histidine kinase
MADADQTDSGTAPRRSIGRLLIIIGVVTSLVIATLASAVAFRLSNEDAILEDMTQVMNSVSNETVENAASFLAPAERNAAELANLVQAGILDSPAPLSVDRLFYERLRVNESFDGIFMGADDGSFLYVHRLPDSDTFEKKEVTIDPSGRRIVRNTLYDQSFEPVESSLDPDDQYDPRTRPWYLSAVEVGPTRGAWTDPYIFFSTGVPGVTRSAASGALADGQTVVVGIDMAIGELSTFIEQRRASKNGSSYILDRQLNVVAHPDMSVLSIERELATSSDVDDPLLNFVATNIEGLATGPESKLIRGSVEGTDYHVVLTSLENNDEWIVAVAAPDDDFLGRVRDAQRRTLALTAFGGITSIAALLAGGWVVNKRYRRERSLAQSALAAAEERSEERDVARSKLTDTVDQLARSNADLEQYAYATAHDLRTPLRAMGGYAELLLREAEDAQLDPTLEGYAQRIVDSYERMCLTMDNLLEHARTTVHQPPDETIPLTPIVRQALMDFENEIERLDVDVQLGVLPDAAVDPIGMTRVFQNLLSNAMRYRDPSRRCEIRITGEQHGATSVVRFADNGVGIKPSDHELVFQLFRRASGDAEGSGVGLALVKKIIDEHGGTIELESELGVGTTMIISLPTEPAQANLVPTDDLLPNEASLT